MSDQDNWNPTGLHEAYVIKIDAAESIEISGGLKEHRYPPYEHHFDDLCDAGCGRPVPTETDDGYLTRLGWHIRDDGDYVDGTERICPFCSGLQP